MTATILSRSVWFGLFGLVCLGVASCGWDGQLCILGYTTRPNYDPNIHTIHVPIFKNRTFIQGLEFDLTRAVIREIESKTPWKVVADSCPADTELTGTIVNYAKNVINRNQLNEIREGETILSVEVVWRDLRSGDVLSRPRPGPSAPPPPPPAPGAPVPPPPPVLIQSIGRLVPELGQSLASAEKENVDRLAVQIVSMMEKPW